MASNLTQAERLYSKPNDFSQATAQRYSYSFSGADAKTFCFFPQAPHLIRPLDTVHTISVSVHEGKSQVRSLGYRGMKGMTRSVRTIAGSIILTVVNDHPLRALTEQYNTLVGSNGRPPFGWSIDQEMTGVGNHSDQFSFQNRLASLLPPFNILIEFVAEGAPVIKDATNNNVMSGHPDDERDLGRMSNRMLFPGAGILLQGIEIIDEGFIVSVNDIVTEITCSYVARDFKPISANTFSDARTGATLRLDDIAAREQDLMDRIFNTSSAPAASEDFSFGDASSQIEVDEEDPDVDDGQIIRTRQTSVWDGA